MHMHTCNTVHVLYYIIITAILYYIITGGVLFFKSDHESFTFFIILFVNPFTVATNSVFYILPSRTCTVLKIYYFYRYHPCASSTTFGTIVHV